MFNTFKNIIKNALLVTKKDPLAECIFNLNHHSTHLINAKQYKLNPEINYLALLSHVTKDRLKKTPQHEVSLKFRAVQFLETLQDKFDLKIDLKEVQDAIIKNFPVFMIQKMLFMNQDALKVDNNSNNIGTLVYSALYLPNEDDALAVIEDILSYSPDFDVNWVSPNNYNLMMIAAAHAGSVKLCEYLLSKSKDKIGLLSHEALVINHHHFGMLTASDMASMTEGNMHLAIFLKQQKIALLSKNYLTVENASKTHRFY